MANTISAKNMVQLVLDNADKLQVEGYVCIGKGISFKYYGVEAPFSLIDLLGVETKDMYVRVEKQAIFGFSDDNHEMQPGYFGADPTNDFYITTQKYQELLAIL